ncbi:MAG TPA: hypothetical protein PKV21_07425 [bacterium]|nr:hypothetical protein [bacterium]
MNSTSQKLGLNDIINYAYKQFRILSKKYQKKFNLQYDEISEMESVFLHDLGKLISSKEKIEFMNHNTYWKKYLKKLTQNSIRIYLNVKKKNKDIKDKVIKNSIILQNPPTFNEEIENLLSEVKNVLKFIREKILV